ncbi:MAG TPA: hypothetical protein VF765_34905 [Polyangiaceae bacterium]
MNQYQQPNPYAAPQAQAVPANYAQGPTGARIEGDTLVVANGMTFPPVCTKCGNTQGIEWHNQKFVYTPFWAWYVLGWIGYLIFTKRSRFAIPVCQPCHAQWKKWNLLLGLSVLPLFLLGALCAAIASAVDDSGAIVGITFMVGIFACLAALVVVAIMRAKKVVLARKIDSSFTWLRGVHPNVVQMIGSGAAPQAYAQPMMQQGYAPQPGYPQR